MNLDPDVWGPPLWYEMHMKSFEFPNFPTLEEKSRAISYFNKIADILPCEKCAVHYKTELYVNPVEFNVGSKEELSRWLVNLHNNVNIRLGKRIVSYQEAVKMYT